MRVAIPTYQNRVSPVIDSCAHMLIFDIDQAHEKERENVFLGDMPLGERCRLLRELGVGIVVCGGISETFEKLLQGSNIRLISGIAGDIEAVLAAFLTNRLDNPDFYMPGYKTPAKLS